jgi:tRNA(Ile2) C34 agmatinyltransferase TiaS
MIPNGEHHVEPYHEGSDSFLALVDLNALAPGATSRAGNAVHLLRQLGKIHEQCFHFFPHHSRKKSIVSKRRKRPVQQICVERIAETCENFAKLLRGKQIKQYQHVRLL